MKAQVRRNNFDALSKSYDAARRGYPATVYHFLKKFIPDKHAKVLDLGCGTGIATRELKLYGFKNVTGADKGAKMIQFARKRGGGIHYIVAPAHKLPFKDGELDVVTAFTAFHWFDDAKSVREIKRVLKPGGIFFAVGKTYHSSVVPVWHKKVEELRRAYRAIMDRYFGVNVDSAKNYHPVRTLKRYGFIGIKEASFPCREKYTVSQAMTLLKSSSNWNLLNDKRRAELYRELEHLYWESLVGGFILRDRVAEVVVGRRR